MDCNTARLLISLNAPSGGELSGDDAALLDAHLSGCVDCAALTKQEQQFDNRMATAMCAVPIPIDLKQRIVARVKAEDKSQNRRWVRPLALSVAAAAAMFLVVVVIYNLNVRKPVPSLREVGEYDVPASAHEAEALFQEKYGVHIVAPDQFDYDNLKEYKMVPQQKRQVPVLVFTKNLGGRDVVARVFIFSDHDFDLSKLESEPSEYRVKVLPSPNKHFAYVVNFTSDRLDDFFPNSGTGVAME